MSIVRLCGAAIRTQAPWRSVARGLVRAAADAQSATLLVRAAAGDYLKTRRALIRAVEKQAAMAERMDALKTAIFEGAL